MNRLMLFFFAFLIVGCSSITKQRDFIFPNPTDKAKYVESYNATLTSAWNVGYEEMDVKTDFGTAHVIAAGPEDADVLILFHGTDSSSTMWYPNIEALSKNHRAYAIDFPMEAGKSMSRLPNFSNPEIARFYKAVFEKLKLKSMTFVAVSRGGWVATYLAIDPEIKVEKLILLSPAQTYGGIEKLGKTLSAMSLKTFPSCRRLDMFFSNFSSNPEIINSEYKEQFYLANKFGHSKPGLSRMTRFSKIDLAKLKMPILVMIGENDVINGPKSLINAKLFTPQADTLTVKNAGHFISVDQADFVNSKILEFLQQPNHNPVPNAEF